MAKVNDKREFEQAIREEADQLFGSIIDGAKASLFAYIHHKECELRQERDFKEIAENKLESVIALCRRARSEGKLDDETYKSISIIRTNGNSEDYKPEGYQE